jgi:predicted GNAT superfamily acetyltransferase
MSIALCKQATACGARKVGGSMGHSYKHGRGNHHNQYSHEYHLSRAVRCSECGVALHKTHQFVWYGNRCMECYRASFVVESAASQREGGL